MDSSNVARIVGSDMTVSDKIRALNEAGYPRADIARVLGKRYQHVRNVLEADKLHPVRPAAPSANAQPRPGVEETQRAFGGVHRLNVEAGGLVRLPADVQAVLGARPGGVLIGELQDDRFVILSGRAAAMRARDIVMRNSLDPSRILSEELIAERRAEAARE
jgi:hypothetical protein